MKEVFTIGHSSHSTEYFLELLKSYSINSIVDIRSVPFSKFVPHFNKDIIKRILNVNKIHCIYMGDELGIVQNEKQLYSAEGYLDFERVRESSNFIQGINRIKAGIDKGYIIAIMCTEKDPLDCHRSILITRELHRQGYSIKHILPEGNTQTHEEFEERLLKLYYPNQVQENFFHPFENSEVKIELINQSYIRRNRDLCKPRK